jgi:hypothetical protein
MVRRVVVAHQVQQSMQQEPPDVQIESQCTRRSDLIICGFRRYENVAKVFAISAKRQNVRWLVKTAILAVVTPHCIVGQKYSGKRTRLDFKLTGQALQEDMNSAGINPMLSLPVQEQGPGASFPLPGILNFPQTAPPALKNAVVAAAASADSRSFRKRGQYAGPGDGGQHPFR